MMAQPWQGIVPACNRLVRYPIPNHELRIAASNDETVDQAMELLGGEQMGERQEDGTYPAGSMNAQIEERLRQFAEECTEYLILATNHQDKA